MVPGKVKSPGIADEILTITLTLTLAPHPNCEGDHASPVPNRVKQEVNTALIKQEMNMEMEVDDHQQPPEDDCDDDATEESAAEEEFALEDQEIEIHENVYPAKESVAIHIKTPVEDDCDDDATDDSGVQEESALNESAADIRLSEAANIGPTVAIVGPNSLDVNPTIAVNMEEWAEKEEESGTITAADHTSSTETLGVEEAEEKIYLAVTTEGSKVQPMKDERKKERDAGLAPEVQGGWDKAQLMKVDVTEEAHRMAVEKVERKVACVDGSTKDEADATESSDEDPPTDSLDNSRKFLCDGMGITDSTIAGEGRIVTGRGGHQGQMGYQEYEVNQMDDENTEETPSTSSNEEINAACALEIAKDSHDGEEETGQAAHDKEEDPLEPVYCDQYMEEDV